VKTPAQRIRWLQAFKRWSALCHDYLKEKTYHDALTPTGRQRWSYTHSKLHNAYLCLRNALPNLFTLSSNPKCDTHENLNKETSRGWCSRIIFFNNKKLIRKVIVTFHKHFAPESRSKLEGFLEIGMSVGKIALALGCHRSSVYREIK